MLRPALVLLCAAAVGASGRQALDAAVCVEMIHDWSLLHDDVMDRDEMRRHQRSVWAQFGVAQAVLAGDVLLGLAFGRAARLPFPSALLIADTVEELCVGQWADLDLAGGSACSVDQALMMVGAKTGWLLALSCSLGARAGGADLGRAALFAQFGRELGIAYQAADDLLGIWGDPAVTGKPAGADIAARKASLPIVAAVTSGTPAGDELAGLLGSTGPLDTAAVRHAGMLIDTAGGRAWAEAEVLFRTEQALECLRAAVPTASVRADLEAVATYLVGRHR